MLGQNLQNVGDQIMDFYLAKTYKKGLPKTPVRMDVLTSVMPLYWPIELLAMVLIHHQLKGLCLILMMLF